MTKNLVNKGKISQVVISKETVICNVQLQHRTFQGVGIEDSETYKKCLEVQFK